MMGYTHTIISASCSLTASLLIGNKYPASFVTALTAGIVGGVISDVDIKDIKGVRIEITDAGRTRLAVFILLIVEIVRHLITAVWNTYNMTLFQYMSSLRLKHLLDAAKHNMTVTLGIVCFVLITFVASFTKHRTFSHSLLFIGSTTVCLFFIYPFATFYYLIGCVSHIILDLLNETGVQLFYPARLSPCLGVCESDRKGNKITYFIGAIAFIGLSVSCLVRIGEISKCLYLIIVLIYILIAMEIVRIKSEREIRILMHMRKEIPKYTDALKHSWVYFLSWRNLNKTNRKKR